MQAITVDGPELEEIEPRISRQEAPSTHFRGMIIFAAGVPSALGVRIFDDPHWSHNRGFGRGDGPAAISAIE